MLLSQQLKNLIEKRFGIKFDVSSNISNNIEEYDIIPSDSNNNYFNIKTIIRNDSRLTIICEPSKYGAKFVKLLSQSSYEQRTIFTNYWEQLEKKFKVEIKINENTVSKEQFLNFYNWKKFYIRITTPMFYDSEKENKKDVVCKYIYIILAMIFSLLDINVIGYEEGKAISEKHLRYERNPINRELCLLAKGHKCSICGFLFEDKYGQIGNEFIEVHHVKPVSMMDEDYIVDPINDLVPLCSNCHSMIHKKNPPFSPIELKKIICEVQTNEFKGNK